MKTRTLLFFLTLILVLGGAAMGLVKYRPIGIGKRPKLSSVYAFTGSVSMDRLNLTDREKRVLLKAADRYEDLEIEVCLDCRSQDPSKPKARIKYGLTLADSRGRSYLARHATVLRRDFAPQVANTVEARAEAFLRILDSPLYKDRRKLRIIQSMDGHSMGGQSMAVPFAARAWPMPNWLAQLMPAKAPAPWAASSLLCPPGPNRPVPAKPFRPALLNSPA